MSRIYITHCSARKDDSLRGTGRKVTPDRLYIAQPLQRFVKRCRDEGVDWAIFSDKYGVVFPKDKIEWYNKAPSTVTEKEFQSLVKNFIQRLSGYDEIWFYRNPGRFHKLYEKLLKEVRSRGLNVKLFSHLSEIPVMSEECKWLNEKLEELPLIKYPFNLESLPPNGIYFFYEKGEIWGHGGEKLRIVRIGTHEEDNLKDRIAEHFLIVKSDKRMNFDKNMPKPSDRSIFRKNIGRVLLNKNKAPYLEIWEKDFTIKANRKKYGDSREIEKEKSIEKQITKILRSNFSFRFIIVENEDERFGLESKLIGTVSRCAMCKPSKNWLGNYSPRKGIRTSGLWLIQHLNAEGITKEDKSVIEKSIQKTKDWIKKQPAE